MEPRDHTYWIHAPLFEVEKEWKRLQTIEYTGEANRVLNEIRKIFPGFVPVGELEIFYRARYLGIPHAR